MFLLQACLRRSGSSSARILSNHTPKLQSSTSSLLLPTSSSTTLLPPSSSLPTLLSTLDIRSFSSSGNDGGENNNNKQNDHHDDDSNILLHDEDSLPTPPSYVRDAVTGKWTNQTLKELSSKDRKLLNLDDESKSDEVMDRLGEKWKAAASSSSSSEAATEVDDGFGTLNAEHERVARRIQEEQLALGTIGRDPAYSVKKRGGDNANDNDNTTTTPADTTKPLTPRELQALKTYAQKEHSVHPNDFARIHGNDPHLIPTQSITSGPEGSMDSKEFFDADLDLAYLNPKLSSRAFKDEGTESSDNDPFADLLPSDLNPARKVNRRHAKPIPHRLLHQNNLSLLRRYTTPGGKIMNRVQSRLGAKEQRKIAKLVKRARHLGLIPHLGQWKFEDHGNLHEENLANASPSSKNVVEGKRDWEVELEQRGLWPLQDETELVKRYYDLDKMMENIAGPRGGRKRDELERLLGGMGGSSSGLAKEEGVGGGGASKGGS